MVPIKVEQGSGQYLPQKPVENQIIHPPKLTPDWRFSCQLIFLFQEILKFNIVKNRSFQGSDSSDAMVHIKRANMIPK